MQQNEKRAEKRRERLSIRQSLSPSHAYSTSTISSASGGITSELTNTSTVLRGSAANRTKYDLWLSQVEGLRPPAGAGEEDVVPVKKNGSMSESRPSNISVPGAFRVFEFENPMEEDEESTCTNCNPASTTLVVPAMASVVDEKAHSRLVVVTDKAVPINTPVQDGLFMNKRFVRWVVLLAFFIMVFAALLVTGGLLLVTMMGANENAVVPPQDSAANSSSSSSSNLISPTTAPINLRVPPTSPVTLSSNSKERTKRLTYYKTTTSR